MKKDDEKSFNKKKGDEGFFKKVERIDELMVENIIKIECEKCGMIYPSNNKPICNSHCPKCGHKESCE